MMRSSDGGHGGGSGGGSPGRLHTLTLTPELRAFSAGRDARIYDSLGAHLAVSGGVSGVAFGVWAPEASSVSVIGEFNGWRPTESPLKRLDEAGVWHGFVPGAKRGQMYKFLITARDGTVLPAKADPLAFYSETSPATASIVWSLDYDWGDGDWMATRRARQSLDAPISIYEVHLGSFLRVLGEGNRSLGYREIAPLLAEHVKAHGFTHVELMPVMEHPFFGSWGYQVTGYFAPTARFGTPQDLMYLVDYLHREGVGVIFDWVPGHFATDAHGLGIFDGTHLYEHADPRKGYHPEWTSYIFNFGRNEVKSFLLSSAMFWVERYHADGIRVDGVASMLHLDYARKPGEWVPNEHGGRENLEAVAFLRTLNETLYAAYPDIQTIAEESTAWPLVTKPTSAGGLGFGLKWDMGFMHDTLGYMKQDPIHRKHHHNALTFRSIYAYSESFLLPLSHDEVVHEKGSLLGKMPGDEWQKHANLRLLYAYMWMQPGKKLLFMGGELAQIREWNHDGSIDFSLREAPLHAGVAKLVGELNRIYRQEPALHERDTESDGFEWIDGSNAAQSVLTFIRKAADPKDVVLAAFNFTPVPRREYRIGVPRGGVWRELLNSDAKEYGGSGHGNMGAVEANPVPWNGRRNSINVTLPPLGAVIFKPG